MSLFTAETVDEVKKLIELGHDVNLIKHHDKSVLHHFCKKGNLDIVKVLCEAGANVNAQWFYDYPIDIVVKTGYLNIVKYLIENYSVKLDNVLYHASYHGHIDILDYLLTSNLELINLNSKDDNPLIWACQRGHIDAVDRLLYAGADTNIMTRTGTALIVATINNRLDIVKKLVMFGANYHTCGGHALFISCCYSNYEISKFLINLGCNVNYCVDKVTPLMYACTRNNLKTVKLLLERGADPNIVNDKGKKALYYCKSDEVRALFTKN